MKRNVANMITLSRVAAALLMLAAPVCTVPFWALYAWCGVSDMMDGAIARRLGTKSRLGSRLDSASDLVFVGVCLIALLPVFPLPSWLFVWIALIALCKIAGYASGLVMRGRLIALHTTANRAAGLLLFATIPAVLCTSNPFLALPACAAATFAAVQEGHLIRRGAQDAE
ncbi:MAG: CDP-alcohol phosphatidyltransferase family protein [Eggerthellales bacterium]|nr:CDP-alcohol phosphatidyltransferase family protein [Eggerthellales bacterium]